MKRRLNILLPCLFLAAAGTAHARFKLGEVFSPSDTDRDANAFKRTVRK